MIFNLLQALGWMSVLVIYDDRHTNNTFWKELENLPSSMRLILINWNGTIEDALDRMESKEHNINIVLKCSLDCVESTLIQGEEYEKKEDSFTSFKHRSRWLIFTDQWQEVDIRNIKLDHVTFIDPYQNITLTNFLMINTLTWGPERQRYVTESGPDLENLTTSEMFPNIKYGLNKKHFRVVTKVWPPYVVDKTTDKDDKIVYEGLCADLVKVMADIMNFTYAFQLSPDNEWGRIVNGTWTGLIGSLQRREADLMASSIGISEDREKVMDFTFPYMFIHGVAMFKLRNNPYEEKWLTLLKPFSWRVLMCIGVSLVVAALLYHLIEISNPFYISPPTQTVWFRLEYLYGALLSHGCGQLPEALAGRVFVSWWWLFCMILAASYSGTLIATLTITKDQFPFTTLSEMIQQEQYKWGCLDKTLFIPLFSNSTNEVFSSIWDGIVEFNQTDPRVLSSTRNDHYNLVLDSDYVFLTDDANYACQGHNNCHLRLLKDEYFSLNFAFGLQNHSPYTGQFSLIYAFQLSPDNEWGRIVNGTWTGLIGSLQRREADLMASSIGISEDREKVMDFTFPYMFIHGVAMFKLRNNPYEEKWLTLLKPFSWRVLMCIGVSLVVAALLYHLIEISNPFYISPPTQTVWFRLEYLYGALLSHGCGQLPEALAGRVFVSWWWLFCMILAASYSGTLIATLTITKDQFPFTTLSEMIQQEQYKWGCLDKTLFIPLFSNSTNEVFSSIWDGIVEFNQTDPRVLSSTRNDHYNLVLDSDYVFLTDDANYACQGHNNCHLRLLKDEYFSLNFAFGLQNHSPYTGQFSLMALRLFESHHVDFLRNIWWGRKKCSERDLVVSKNIDLVSLQSVFYFLVMGVFLAALSLMFEVAAFLWKRQVKRNMNENVKSIK